METENIEVKRPRGRPAGVKFPNGYKKKEPQVQTTSTEKEVIETIQ